MKIKQNRIYPFPVLSPSTEDYVDNNFAADVDVEYDSETAVVTVVVEIPDERIIELIENRDVGLYCHIECSATKYRELFEIKIEADKSRYSFEIPLYKLNDAIEIMCVLVSKDSINGFTDENLNSIYEGESIDFPAYATMGYTDTTEINITKRIDINGDVPSIFSICKDETGDKVTYGMDGDQIVVYLPADEYDIYENYKGCGTRVKQMMLNIPVLVEVLNEIKADKDSYVDKAWYSVLEASYKKKGFEDSFDDEKFINKDSLVLSQMILGDIAKDAFDEFDKMNRER